MMSGGGEESSEKTHRLELKAVHEKDLEAFLKSINLYEPFREGQLHCFVCRDVITIENLGAILSIGGEARFVCTKLECTEAAKFTTTQG